MQKIKKNSSIFVIFLHFPSYFSTKKLYINKTVATCKLKIAEVIGVFSVHIWGSKTKQKLKKLAQK